MKFLSWDTRYFGYKVARINTPALTSAELKNTLQELSKQRARLAYWFVNPKDKLSNRAARENYGFLADEKTTYIKDISRKANFSKNIHIKSWFKRRMDIQLKSLSLEAGVYSRYKVDSNFDNGEFEKLYTEWIKKSLSGEIAKDVFVYEINKRKVGFITLSDKNGRCNIGLIAVDPKYRDKGIGRELVETALEKAVSWGYKKMDVVTQKTNIGTCKFYEKMDFKRESIVNVYHFWINDLVYNKI